MSSKMLILLLVGVVIVIGIIGATVALTREEQDPRSSAQTTGCQIPAQVQNVQIVYPHENADSTVNFTQADCTWGAVAGATGYDLTIIDTGNDTVVKNERVGGSVTSTVFAVTQGRTYQCDIAAVNSCGQSGPIGTVTATCEADAGVVTPTFTPTSSPSPTPIITGVVTFTPTPTLPPGITPINITSTPIPTLPPTGVFENSLLIGGGASFLILLGAVLFLL